MSDLSKALERRPFMVGCRSRAVSQHAVHVGPAERRLRQVIIADHGGLRGIAARPTAAATIGAAPMAVAAGASVAGGGDGGDVAEPSVSEGDVAVRLPEDHCHRHTGTVAASQREA